MGEITRYRPDWSQDSAMRIIAYLAPDAQGDAVTYADHLADREQLQITLKGWLKENAPGGWIDDLRKENAALKEQVERLKKLGIQLCNYLTPEQINEASAKTLASRKEAGNG